MDTTNGNVPHAEAAIDDAEGRRPLGEIFVELGFITRTELDAALAEQLRTGICLGEILVAHGSLTRLDLATALAERWEPHFYPQSGDADLAQAAATFPEVAAVPVEPELRVDDAAAARAPISGADDLFSELAARMDALTVLVGGLQADLAGLAERYENGDSAELAAIRVEAASLAGRFDELLGLRHADAHAARAASERLDGRLTALATRQADEAEAVRAALVAMRADRGLPAELETLGGEVAELGRRLDRQGSIGEEQARAIESAVLRGLNALGEQLIRSAKKGGKPGKRLRRSIDDLAVVIAGSEARIAERGALADTRASRSRQG